MKDAAYLATYLAIWMLSLIALGFACRVMWWFIKIGWDIL